MKRIGIITYFNYYNYGSMLQGFALQHYIQNNYSDIDCELINFRSIPPNNTSFWRKAKVRFNRIGYYLTHLSEIRTKSAYHSKMSIRNTYFDIFLNTQVKVTPEFYRNKSQLMQHPPIYDIYITGSDQTWSPNISGGYDLSPMFLDFAVGGARKAAYAPSVGVSKFTHEQESFLKCKLNSYSLISCREVGGAKLLERITGKEVPPVIDPTLLLNKNQWEKLAVPSEIKVNYIFCYFLGSRQYYRDFAKKLSMQTGLPIVCLPVNWKDFSNDDNLVWNAGPLEFVGLINGAEYVCTDSFHGVAFSSNLNKNFYAFIKHAGLSDAGDNSRLFDYLKRIGLEDRLITEYDGNEICVKSIDYSSVNERLAKERENSYRYIDRIIQL